MIDTGTLSSQSVTDKDFAGNYGLKVAMAMGWFAGDKNMSTPKFSETKITYRESCVRLGRS